MLKSGVYSEEYLIKMRERPKKPILQFDLEMNFIKEWDSIVGAARTLSLHEASISHCLGGRYKQHHGFVWKYKNAV